jgi:syntaxin 5
MKKIEGTIGALGSMFSRLSTLIQQQGEEVDLIDDNLEAAEEDVIAAEGELLKYFALVKGNRGLIVKVFLGLAIFSVTMMIIYG